MGDEGKMKGVDEALFSFGGGGGICLPWSKKPIWCYQSSYVSAVNLVHIRHARAGQTLFNLPIIIPSCCRSLFA